MRIGFKILSNYCHYIFFTLFFVLGICIFKDFGFNIDESFHRRIGFYWLNFLSDFLNLENISNISKKNFYLLITVLLCLGGRMTKLMD